MRWVWVLVAVALGIVSIVLIFDLSGVRSRMIDRDVDARQRYIAPRRRFVNRAVIGDSEADRDSSSIVYPIVGVIAGLMAVILLVVSLS